MNSMQMVGVSDMGALSFYVYVPSCGSREVIISRKVIVNRREYMETAGTLMWDGDQFSWQLPEEAYMATMLTPKEVACVLGLLNWLNRPEV